MRRKIVKIVEGRPPEDFIGPRPAIDSIGGLRVDAKRRRLWAVSGTDSRMDGYIASEPVRNGRSYGVSILLSGRLIRWPRTTLPDYAHALLGSPFGLARRET